MSIQSKAMIEAGICRCGSEFNECCVERAVAYAIRECARVAENVKDGYSAVIRTCKHEQEFSKDKDGPWVLNTDVAKAILSAAGIRRKGDHHFGRTGHCLDCGAHQWSERGDADCKYWPKRKSRTEVPMR